MSKWEERLGRFKSAQLLAVIESGKKGNVVLVCVLSYEWLAVASYMMSSCKVFYNIQLLGRSAHVAAMLGHRHGIPPPALFSTPLNTICTTTRWASAVISYQAGAARPAAHGDHVLIA
jgi:hypothetical protein